MFHEYAQNLAIDKKKKNGIYYTPKDIAQILAKKAKDLGTGIFLDPSCGTGILGFELAKLQDNPIDFVLNQLIINDIDEKALEIAKSIFYDEFNVIPKTLSEDFLQYDNFPDYDYILMNPPYFKYENKDFESYDCKDIYGYFLEKAYKTTKGFISINPVSFTNGKKFQKLRKILLQRGLELYHFDNIPGHIFEDAKTRASIIISKEKEEYSTTSLLRWKSAERKSFFDSLDAKVGEALFTEEIFFKTSPETYPLLNSIISNKPLSKFLSKDGDYKLWITSAPRYFITASSEELNRKGQHEISFKTEEEWKKWYILLNSSYLYWWWRICDSNLSLTVSTLKSLPNLDIEPNEELIQKLKQSEEDNKVYKANAGELQENIKHPLELIDELNQYILPTYANSLIQFHD